MRRIDPLPPLLDLPVDPPTTQPAPVLDYVVIVPVVALIVWVLLKLLGVM
jgi:hypothetical protein